MNFRATFKNEKGEEREERFEYDYDATALVEPYAETLAREGEELVSVVRESSILGTFG